MIKDKSFISVYVVYLVLMVMDFTTTLMNPHHQLLEANPIYVLTGSFVPIVVLNVLIACAIYWLYKRERSGPTMRFMVMNIITVVIMVRIFAIRIAIQYLANPITVERAVEIGTAANKVAMAQKVSLLIYLPLFLTMITFWLWNIDHEVQRK